ncbi:MAG: hypothetical protein OWU32_08905, partial [Firmicutes bacterium]|nr:hypothetical protein [Bacillota bacterium]
TGIELPVFERTRKKAVGRFLSLLDSPQGLANVYTQQLLRGLDVLTTLDLLRNLSLNDVNAALKAHVQPDQFSVSIVWPKVDGSDPA